MLLELQFTLCIYQKAKHRIAYLLLNLTNLLFNILAFWTNIFRGMKEKSKRTVTKDLV